MKGHLIIVCIWIGILTSCEPCADCGKPLLFDPNVKLKFINVDSLHLITDSITETSAIIKTMTTEKDSLKKRQTAWNTLINQLRDSIADGKTQYVDDTVRYDDSVKTVKASLLVVEDSITTSNTLKTLLTKIQTVINSGKVRVDQVEILENGRSITYEDSATIYYLPLLMQNADITTFSIELAGETHTISFQYKTNLFVDAERKVEMRAYDIDTVSYTYDSLLFECTTDECLSNEVLVTIYF